MAAIGFQLLTNPPATDGDMGNLYNSIPSNISPLDHAILNYWIEKKEASEKFDATVGGTSLGVGLCAGMFIVGSFMYHSKTVRNVILTTTTVGILGAGLGIGLRLIFGEKRAAVPVPQPVLTVIDNARNQLNNATVRLLTNPTSANIQKVINDLNGDLQVRHAAVDTLSTYSFESLTLGDRNRVIVQLMQNVNIDYDNEMKFASLCLLKNIVSKFSLGSEHKEKITAIFLKTINTNNTSECVDQAISGLKSLHSFSNWLRFSNTAAGKVVVLLRDPVTEIVSQYVKKTILGVMSQEPHGAKAGESEIQTGT